MPSTVTLSSMTGLIIAGAGLGLYMGKSAISEINPAYFDSSVTASRFHANLVANAPSIDGAPLSLQAATGLGSGCVNCRTYPEEYIPVPDPAVEGYTGSYASYTNEAVERIMADAEEYVDSAPSREELERIQRYAHYRVSSEEAPAVTAASADPADTDEGYATQGASEEEVEAEAIPAA